MHRVRGLLVLALLLIPTVSHAIQLHWSSGADTLTFTEATRAILVLRADSAEVTLPPEWRLLWVGDSTEVQVVELDSLEVCAGDTAQVYDVEGPSTPEDSTAHLVTARFCSGGSEPAEQAVFQLDLPAWGRGKCKVVALDPADSASVLESNEVTFNGGVADDYAPVLLSASSTHETALLQVTAIGAELASVQSMMVGAPDGLWSVPLTVAERSSTRMTGTAEVHVALPEAAVRVGNAGNARSLVGLAADLINTNVAYSAGCDTIMFRDPNPSVYPKDFAFHYNSVYDPTDPAHPWKGIFHLLYIRNKAGLDSIIAHAWTDSLGKAWSVDSMAFRPSGVGWDKKRVWAPSIQQIGNLTYMFYTGVDSLGNQSIGYATTEMLGTTNISWTRKGLPVYTARDAASWADTVGHQVPGVLQFRDPYIMPDPDVAHYPGRYLLFNAGEDAALTPYYAVGVARNVPGTVNSWSNLGRYEATDHNHLALPGSLESPMVVRDSLTGAWRMFVANGNYDPNGYYSTIFLTQTVGDSLSDISASSWPQCDTLFHYVGDDADVIGWQACEHLQIGQVHFFAAYEGNGIGITRMHWDPVAQKFIFVYPDVTAVLPGSVEDGVHLRVAVLPLGGGVARLCIESVDTIAPRLTVYDVMGRRVRRLLDGRAIQGRSEVTWDCHDEEGNRVPAGVYFARLTGAGETQAVRIPVVR